MKASDYAGGFFGLFKDFFRFIVFGLKNPHYVVIILAVIVGIFHLCGIPPREISGFVSGKWNAFVENRIQTFKEDYQLLSKRFFKKEVKLPDLEKEQEKAVVNAKKQQAKRAKELAEQQVRQMQEETFGWRQAFDSAQEQEKKIKQRKQEKEEHAEQQVQQLREEAFGWQKAMKTTKKKEKNSEGNAVEGVLTVVGADRVRVGDRTFSLNVRLRAGKASEAYQDLKHRFDGRKAKCFPVESNPDRAECFAGKSSLSQMLVDFAYADPI